MRLNSARLTRENYSAGCGNACPLCGAYRPSPYTGGKPFHTSAYEQHFIGWAGAPFPGRLDDVAAVFECQSCFGIYWFHLPKRSIPSLELRRKELRRLAVQAQQGDKP